MRKFQAMLALSIAIAVVAVAAPPAEAATPQYCDGGNTCIWVNRDYQGCDGPGDLIAFKYDIPYYSQYYYNNGINADNSASSMYNHDTINDYLYKGNRCSSYGFQKPPNSTDVDFSNGSPVAGDGSSFNDQVSSGSDAAHLTACKNGS